MSKRGAVGVVLLLVILAGGALSMDAVPAPQALAHTDPDASRCDEGYGLPNPAVVYCGELGYRMKTVQVGVKMLIDAEGASNWGVIMAGTVSAVIPTLLVFFILQPLFVKSLTRSGIKG